MRDRKGEAAMPLALQALPRHALSGFGRSRWSDCRVAGVESMEQLAELFARCRADRVPVALRGSGRSYGDPAQLAGGLVVDTTRLSRVTRWDPATGVLEAQPGLTIEGLWRHILPDGYWPMVVPGTMRPTLGGCLSMNVHGKNNFRHGPIGEHVLDFDLLTTDGTVLQCSRTQNADVFHAAISGLGLLGAFTRIRLQQKRVESGLLRVRAFSARGLSELFEIFEQRLPSADYLVGWVDCLAGGRGLGRGLVHDANYVARDEDPFGARSLQLEHQSLPGSVLGVPKSLIPLLLRPFMNNLGVRLVNAAKYYASRFGGSAPFFQSHVGFAFLFDYIPGWERAYGPHGLIQLQVFAPAAEARHLFAQVIERSRNRGLPAYLGVMKRHRPDAFLLSHGLDGFSLALDYPRTARNGARLQLLLRELTDLALDHGGKFYFAKDSVMTSTDALRLHGPDVLQRFFALKQRLDPESILQSDLSRRVFGADPERRPACES
jgi:decaprenylphospho-beta-D-ribofuranose 2-oxidase